MRWWKKHGNKPEYVDRKIIGVTLGWDLRPHICFDGGYILFGHADRVLYPQYFTNGDWPTDPATRERLPIAPVGGVKHGKR